MNYVTRTVRTSSREVASKIVKPGYKHTEIGMIPEDWIINTLGVISEISSGTTPSRALYDRYYKNGSISWLKTLDLNNSVILGTEETVTPFALKETCLQIYPIGTVLVAMYGGYKQIGRTGLLKIPATVNQAITAIQPRNDILDSRYLLETLNYRVDYWKTVASSSRKDPNITSQDIRKFSLIYPSLSEQRVIATALSDVDTLIVSLDNLIAKKRDIKKATMQDLLSGKKRLPGFSDYWENIQFSDLADKSIPWSIVGGPFGSNLKTSDYTKEGVRIIQLQNIGDGRFDNTYAIYTSEMKADELLSNNIYPGEIILSKMGDPIARACFVPTTDRRYLMASDGIRLAVDTRYFNKQFVHDYINSFDFRKKAIDASTGSTRQRIGLVELKHLPFIKPPLSEQYAIATLLSDMDIEIAALEQQRDKTRDMKQGIMQELLNGRIRLLKGDI